jgi:hypothetical protein
MLINRKNGLIGLSYLVGGLTGLGYCVTGGLTIIPGLTGGLKWGPLPVNPPGCITCIPGGLNGAVVCCGALMFEPSADWLSSWPPPSYI